MTLKAMVRSAGDRFRSIGLTRSRIRDTVRPVRTESDTSTSILEVPRVPTRPEDHEGPAISFQEAIQRVSSAPATPIAKSRFAEDRKMLERYRNQFVAYIDEYDGNELRRNFVAFAETKEDIRNQLRALYGEPDKEPRLIVQFVQ